MRKLFSVFMWLFLVVYPQWSFSDESDFSKSVWRFKAYQCAFGCSDVLSNVLKSQIGSTIDLSENGHFRVGTSDLCLGKKQAAFERLTHAALMAKLQQTLPTNRQLTSENTGLEGEYHTSAIVSCVNEAGVAQSVWFVSIGHGQLIAFDEESSFLVYE